MNLVNLKAKINFLYGYGKLLIPEKEPFVHFMDWLVIMDRCPGTVQKCPGKN